MPEQEVSNDLERFVREQAARFGDVISYVPVAKAPQPSTMPTSDLAITEIMLPDLELKLAQHKSEPWYNARTLEELESKINNCQNCRLRGTRTKFVFGVGNPNAKLMIIGE